jgi:hypothetical protein
MNLKAVLSRIKVVHWSWWTLWLGSMALLGLTIVNHQAAGMSELAESFRSPPFPLGIEFCMIKGIAIGAAWAALVSSVLAFTAVERQEIGSQSMAAAVGVIMLYFAYHTLVFMMFSYWYMKGHVRTHVPQAPTNSNQTTPAEK